MKWKTETRLFATMVTLAVFLTLGASVASAQTKIMPDRDAMAGEPVVIWGNTTEAGGSSIVIDFGDSTPDFSGTVSAGSQWTHLGKPYGLYIDSDDTLFMVEGETETLLVVDGKTGRLLETIAGLEQSHWVSMDPEGNVYVAQVLEEAGVLKFAIR